MDYDRSVAAYLKFFTRPTQKRLDRTAWLIGQQMHTWLPGLAAAPLVWVDTRHAHRPADATLDFAGYLARAVPGKTWLELKTSIHDNSLPFPEDFRWRCVRDLVLALSVLEQEGIIHGDLSPNNIVIDLEARPDQPALYLIDFDAFVAPAAGGNEAVTVAEGGTYGTEGYCPPDLAAAAAGGDGSAAPYSDRYGRDMLLVELLLIGPRPLAGRSSVELERGPASAPLRRLAGRSDPACLQTLSHLDPATLFDAGPEEDRPASAELAAGLGLSCPPAAAATLTRAWNPAPAVLGHPLASAHAERLTQQSAVRPAHARRRQRCISSFPGGGAVRRPIRAIPRFWQDLKVALGLAVIPLLLIIAGLINILLSVFSK